MCKLTFSLETKGGIYSSGKIGIAQARLLTFFTDIETLAV